MQWCSEHHQLGVCIPGSGRIVDRIGRRVLVHYYDQCWILQSVAPRFLWPKQCLGQCEQGERSAAENELADVASRLPKERIEDVLRSSLKRGMLRRPKTHGEHTGRREHLTYDRICGYDVGAEEPWHTSSMHGGGAL